MKKKNTFVTVTDARGNKKTGASAGCLGFKGRSRRSRYAAQATAEHVGRSAINPGLMKWVVMKVKGSTYFRKKKKVILSWRKGYNECKQSKGDPSNFPLLLFLFIIGSHGMDICFCCDGSADLDLDLRLGPPANADPTSEPQIPVEPPPQPAPPPRAALTPRQRGQIARYINSLLDKTQNERERGRLFHWLLACYRDAIGRGGGGGGV